MELCRQQEKEAEKLRRQKERDVDDLRRGQEKEAEEQRRQKERKEDQEMFLKVFLHTVVQEELIKQRQEIWQFFKKLIKPTTKVNKEGLQVVSKNSCKQLEEQVE